MSRTHSPQMPFAALLVEQLRVVTLSLSKEAVLWGVLLAGLCAWISIELVMTGQPFSLDARVLLPFFSLAVLLPYLVWRGEPVFGEAFLWSLPASRQRSALAKVAAGGICLMTVLFLTIAVLGALALLTGGQIGGLETGPGRGVASQPALVTQWIAPFVGSMIVYISASAFVLGLKHPLRWLALAFFVWLLLILLVEAIPDGILAGLNTVIDEAAPAFWTGQYGPVWVLTGGSGVWLDPESMPAGYVDSPSFAQWAKGALLWLATSCALLALAVRRHWEG